MAYEDLATLEAQVKVFLDKCAVLKEKLEFRQQSEEIKEEVVQ